MDKNKNGIYLKISITISLFFTIFLIFIAYNRLAQTNQRAENIHRGINPVSDLFDADWIFLESRTSKDPEICNKVEEENKSQCLVYVYTNIAVNNNDSRVCYNLEPFFRSSCLSKMAIISRDLNLCGEIEKDSFRYQCKEGVVQQIAIDTNSVGICDEFEFQGNKYLEAWVPRSICIDQAAFCNMNEDLCEDQGCKDTVRLIRKAGNNKGYICDISVSI